MNEHRDQFFARETFDAIKASMEARGMWNNQTRAMYRNAVSNCPSIPFEAKALIAQRLRP